MESSSSTRYHSDAVKEFNKNARKNGMLDIPFDIEELISDARKQTGLERFGEENFIPDLGVLVNALNTEANLNPFGKFVVRASIVEPLKNRLWANACFEKHPEILDRKIDQMSPLSYSFHYGAISQ